MFFITWYWYLYLLPCRTTDKNEMCNVDFYFGYEAKYEEHFLRTPACMTILPEFSFCNHEQTNGICNWCIILLFYISNKYYGMFFERCLYCFLIFVDNLENASYFIFKVVGTWFRPVNVWYQKSHFMLYSVLRLQETKL